MKFLSDRELAKLTDEEIGEYVTSLFNEGARLRYSYNKPTSKFWKRIADYRKGRDADLSHPKRREFYQYQYGDRKVTIKKGGKTKASKPSESDEEIEAPPPSIGGVKSKGKVASTKGVKSKGKVASEEVKKVVLEVGRRADV